jgi:hypothetical protein
VRTRGWRHFVFVFASACASSCACACGKGDVKVCFFQLFQRCCKALTQISVVFQTNKNFSKRPIGLLCRCSESGFRALLPRRSQQVPRSQLRTRAAMSYQEQVVITKPEAGTLNILAANINDCFQFQGRDIPRSPTSGQDQDHASPRTCIS